VLTYLSLISRVVPVKGSEGMQQYMAQAADQTPRITDIE
jgi:hypothetical protein